MERTWAEERDLQREILSAVFRGEAVDPEKSDRWRLLRARIAAELRAAGAEDARRLLSREIRLEGERLSCLEAGESSESGGAAGGSAAGAPSPFLENLLGGERLRWLRDLSGELFQPERRGVHEVLDAEIDWVRRRALEIAGVDRGLAGEAERLAGETRAVRGSLRDLAVGGWLEAGEAEAGGAAPGAGPGADFHAVWRRVLEHHQIASELAPGERLKPEHLRRLEERRQSDLALCRAALERVGEAERESAALQAAIETEDRVSNLFSEGDLLDAAARAAKLRAAARAIEDFLDVLGGRGARAWRRRDLRRGLRRLGRLRRYALGSARRAEVEGKLDARFGARAMRRAEKLVFLLILLLVVLMVVEWRLETAGLLTRAWALAFQFADLGICSVLLGDFFLRWAYAGWSMWFIRRHFILDFLPALPYGFIIGRLESIEHLPAAEYAHLALLFRALRALGAGLRTIAPYLRLFRLFIFLVRGSDRAVHHFRGFLDRNILLFEPDAPADDSGDPAVGEALKLEGRQILMARELFREVESADRLRLLRGYLSLLDREIASLPPAAAGRPARRGEGSDLQLEALISRLVGCSPADIEAALGPGGARRLARLLRWFDLPLLRRLPVLRRLGPASRISDPLEAVTEAARELGQLLQRVLSLFHVWGDLSGITTGPQVLDRIATAMVRAAQRPAVRLLIFGVLFLIVKLLFDGLEITALEGFFDLINRILGYPLLILGSICMVAYLLGLWFKRISGEALDVYFRTADAHFFPLIKEVKARYRDDLLEILDRVILPECRLRGLPPDAADAAADRLLEDVRGTAAGSLDPPRAASGDGGGSDGRGSLDGLGAEVDQIALLYRDYLDGEILERTDDKTSIQLLGNLAIRDIRTSMLRMGKREIRRLERLALEKDRLLGSGPYLWFRFISESLAIETAKLVMEYNAACLPIDQVAAAAPEVRRRFERFLEEKRVAVDPAARRAARARALHAETPLATTEFSVLHFLTADARRDARIAEVFGREVLEAVVRDRRAVVRDIFGTWPYHRLPRSLRRVNPFRLYFRYLGGARIFLLPLVILGRILGLLFLGLRRLVRIVREVYGRAEVERSRLSRVAGFDVAARKINRMRKPYFMEVLRLRAAVDAEYLGLRIPGTALDPDERTYDDDLEFIGALERERLPLEELRRSAIRDLRRLRTFLSERGWLGASFSECLRILDPAIACERSGEALRAVVTAFITDRYGLRSAIAGPRDVQAFFERTLRQPPPGLLWRLWRAAWHAGPGRIVARNRRRRELFSRYWSQSEHFRQAPPPLRRRALAAFLDAGPDIARGAAIAVDMGASEHGCDEAILGALRRVIAEHALWTRKLITLRTIQTLTVLDIRCYQDLIAALGGYEKERERVRDGTRDSSLHWMKHSGSRSIGRDSRQEGIGEGDHPR